MSKAIHSNNNGANISYYASGSAFIELNASPIFKAPADKADSRNMAKPWELWGTDNKLPMQYLADIENTSILSTIIDAKARICVGKGVRPVKLTGQNTDGTDKLEPVNSADINDFLELNNNYDYSYESAKDLFALGQSVTLFMLNNDFSKIARMKRQDISEVRYAKRTESTGLVQSIFISSNWSNENSNSARNNKYLKEVPVLAKGYEMEALQQFKDKKIKEFAIINQYALQGRRYYSLPSWYPALKWIKIAQSIPDMKAAMFENQMQIKYLIEINELYWSKSDRNFDSYTPEKQAKIKKDFKDNMNAFLTGTKNAYKTVVSDSWFNSIDKKLVPYLQITAIDDKLKEGQLLPDSAAADKHIMFSLMFNPALIGANLLGDGASGGAGSGSDIREAYLVQTLVLEPERRMLSLALNIVKRFNGWDKDIQWRYPNQMLTTMDTGKETKPIDAPNTTIIKK